MMINYTMMLMIMMLIGTPVFNDYVMVMIIDTPVPDNQMIIIELLLMIMVLDVQAEFVCLFVCLLII